MSKSVHVLRTPTLPDNQETAITFHCDGSVTLYMREDLITQDGALALESTLTAARTKYDYQWGHPLPISA